MKAAFTLSPRTGRPKLPPEDRLQQVPIRLKPADAAKLKALGGRRWLEKKLAGART